MLLSVSFCVCVCVLVSQLVPTPVYVPHWSVHVWDVVVFRGAERKEAVVFKAQHWHDECVRVILQIYCGAQCSLHRAAGLPRFVQLQKTFSVINTDSVSCVFHLSLSLPRPAPPPPLCWGHFHFIHQKQGELISHWMRKLWPFLTGLCVCVCVCARARTLSVCHAYLKYIIS